MTLHQDLVAALGASRILTGAEALAYARDRSDATVAGTPAAVALPTTTGEVAAAVRIAAKHATPFVPQGARTGLAGGANAIEGCLVISLEAMNRILEIDAVDRLARVEAGVLTRALAERLAAVGLFYPPDPGSWEICTIGGNIATNAGGMRCVKYGVTRDFVRALTVVLPDGEVVETGRRTVKGVAALDLTSLLVGSEGTLGIVTEATLAVLPAPGRPVGVLATFPDDTAALAAADAVMAGNRTPSILEFLDAGSIAAIRRHDPASTLPAGAGAVLLIQSDEPGRAREDAEHYADLAASLGAITVEIATDPDAVEALMSSRRQLHGALRGIAGASLNEDVAVPRSRLPELLSGVARIADELGLVICSGGHIGDGNLHPVVCYDPADATAVEAAHRAYGRVIALAVSLGGTSSGEHGIGTLKLDHLDAELSPALRELQRAVKRAFDPAGLLNPGRKL